MVKIKDIGSKYASKHMLTLNKLYLIRLKKIEIYKPEQLTPEEFQQKNGINNRLYITVYCSVRKHTFALNYSRMITDYQLAKCTTWQQLVSRLTDEYLNGYEENLPGYVPGTINPARPVTMWDILNTLNTFDIGYGEYISGRKNISHFKDHLPDLYVELQHNPKYNPSLKHCLPVVNGFTCRPYLSPDKQTLWMLDGTRLCTRTSVRFTPEILLFNFENIGDISVHNLSRTKDDELNFKLTFANSKNTPKLSTDWIISSSAYSFFEYTPLIVIGGIIYFPDQYTVISSHDLRFRITEQPLDLALAYKYYLLDDPDSLANVSYQSPALIDFILDEINNDYSKNTFIVLVHTSDLFINRIPLDVWENSIIINLYTSQGILIQDRTGTIRNYHEENNTNLKTLSLQNIGEVFTTDEKYENPQFTMIRPECKHHEFNNLFRSNCTMVSLTK